MTLLQSIYDHSPIFFQHIMTSCSGYQKNHTRYGKTYYAYLDFLREFDNWSLEKQLEFQRNELVKFVNYAYSHSRFYRKLYHGIDIASIKSMADLTKLPVVDKEMLRQNIDDVVTLSRNQAVERHTGGTTGKSLVVFSSVEDSMKRMAMLDHFKERVGFKHCQMKRATFMGKHIIPPGQRKKVFWRYNAACKQMLYSSFHLSEENMGYYAQSLNSFRPDALDGFFTCMCDLAGYIERHNISLHWTPVAIFPTSETLTAPGRELLERVFKCKVYDQYASSEGAPFVTECPNQTLHMELASGVFEHFENGSDEILVTSFTTHGTPLIRYRIGDCMEFAKIPCSCGLHSPTVYSIQGRRLDFIYTADGAKINAGNVANLFKNMPNALIRAKVIQENLGEITILLEVDVERYKPEYDVLLVDEFKHKMGLTTNVVIRHVDEIPKASSGKFRMIENKLGTN